MMAASAGQYGFSVGTRLLRPAGTMQARGCLGPTHHPSLRPKLPPDWLAPLLAAWVHMGPPGCSQPCTLTAALFLLVLPMVFISLGPAWPCPLSCPLLLPSPRALRWLLWLHTGPPAAPHSLGQGGCSVNITREPGPVFLWRSVIYQPCVTNIWTSMLTGPHRAWCRAPGGLSPGQSGGAQSDHVNVCGPAWQCPQCP